MTEMFRWQKSLQCFNKNSRHRVKLASKFHQTCRLLTVGTVVLKHILIHNNSSVPSKLKKLALSAYFLDANWQNFWKSAFANLDAISCTEENFTKQNFVIFSKIYIFFYTFSQFKPFSGHSMDKQQWAVKKSSYAVYKFSACKFVVKMFRARFHDWCVQKWSCLLLSSDAFMKFSPDEVYGESFGGIFTIYASKNNAVSCEV